MTEIKMAVIGGGSSYTPELIEGLIKRYHELPVRELWLVDIPEGEAKLKIITDLAKRMIRRTGIPMDIHLTLDRHKALKDADFIITQFRVGHLDAREKDEKIPLQYGVIGQETNGPGGLFKALRTIPVMLDICREMETLCPEAWLINFTNPAGMVTEAVLRYSNIDRVVGLCNLPVSMRMMVARMLEVDVSRVRIDFAGLNHMIYGLDIYLDGHRIIEQVMDAMSGENVTGFTMENVPDFGWEPDFLKALGAIPCPYHRYYYKTREMYESEKHAFDEEGTRAERVKQLETDMFELYKDPALMKKPPQLEKRGGAYYSDAACDLISSIYNDKGDVQTVNTKNRGAIRSIPDDSAVEVNCVITKDGPRPITVGDVPVQARGLVQSIKSFERVACKAAVTGEYNQALLAMTINPLVPSDTVAKQILDDLLHAHKDDLPQFFDGVE